MTAIPTDPPYQPWNPDAVRRVLAYHRRAAATWKEGSRMQAEHLAHVAALENALACYDALRDRFLEQTTNYRAELGRRQEPTHAA